jgi:hypothetical protein
VRALRLGLQHSSKTISRDGKMSFKTIKFMVLVALYPQLARAGKILTRLFLTLA